MQPINIQDYNWKVEAGEARMVNPYDEADWSDYDDNRDVMAYQDWQVEQQRFEQLAAQHIYATSAPDGEYSGDKFGEVVWQWQMVSEDWRNVEKYTYSRFPSFEEFSKYWREIGYTTRQFLPLKDQPENEVETVEVVAKASDGYKWADCRPDYMDGAVFGSSWQKEQDAATLAQRDAEMGQDFGSGCAYTVKWDSIDDMIKDTFLTK